MKYVTQENIKALDSLPRVVSGGLAKTEGVGPTVWYWDPQPDESGGWGGEADSPWLTGEDDRQTASVRPPPPPAQTSRPPSPPQPGDQSVGPHWPAGPPPGAPGPRGSRERCLDLQRECLWWERPEPQQPQCYQGDHRSLTYLAKNPGTGNGIKTYFLIPHNSL